MPAWFFQIKQFPLCSGMKLQDVYIFPLASQEALLMLRPVEHPEADPTQLVLQQETFLFQQWNSPSYSRSHSSASPPAFWDTTQMLWQIVAIPQLSATPHFWDIVHWIKTSPAWYTETTSSSYTLSVLRKHRVFNWWWKQRIDEGPKRLFYFFLKPPAHTHHIKDLGACDTALSPSEPAAQGWGSQKGRKKSGAYFLQERAVPYIHISVTHCTCWKWISPS